MSIIFNHTDSSNINLFSITDDLIVDGIFIEDIKKNNHKTLYIMSRHWLNFMHFGYLLHYRNKRGAGNHVVRGFTDKDLAEGSLNVPNKTQAIQNEHNSIKGGFKASDETTYHQYNVSDKVAIKFGAANIENRLCFEHGEIIILKDALARHSCVGLEKNIIVNMFTSSNNCQMYDDLFKAKAGNHRKLGMAVLELPEYGYTPRNFEGMVKKTKFKSNKDFYEYFSLPESTFYDYLSGNRGMGWQEWRVLYSKVQDFITNVHNYQS